jgi:hypothetical protein
MDLPQIILDNLDLQRHKSHGSHKDDGNNNDNGNAHSDNAHNGKAHNGDAHDSCAGDSSRLAALMIKLRQLRAQEVFKPILIVMLMSVIQQVIQDLIS